MRFCLALAFAVTAGCAQQELAETEAANPPPDVVCYEDQGYTPAAGRTSTVRTAPASDITPGAVAGRDCVQGTP